MGVQAVRTIEEAREIIARLADEEGEAVFAREVRAGCWDNRTDLQTVLRGTTRFRERVKGRG